MKLFKILFTFFIILQSTITFANEKLDKNLLRFLTVRVKNFDLKTNYFLKDDKTNEK